MIDFSVLQLEDDDSITLGLSGDSQLEETNNGSKRLLQKIVIALKQQPTAIDVDVPGYSLKALIGKKLTPSKIEETKVKVHYLIDTLQKDIIAEQEVHQEQDPEAMLEKVTLANLSVDEIEGKWIIDLIVFDKAGGKTYLKV